MNKSVKQLLLSSVVALKIIGLFYTVAMGGEFKERALIDASLIQLVPEKCIVTEASEGVDANIELKRDEFGNIADRSSIRLIAENVYKGANASYRIVLKNIGKIPLSVDHYTFEINSSSDLLVDSIYFSGSVKIYKNNSEYYDIIGTFRDISITELADNLTNIMKYRKIDITEELRIELDQQFGGSSKFIDQNEKFSYTLVARFIQYFPKSKK